MSTNSFEFELRPSTIGPVRMEMSTPGSRLIEWESSLGDTTSLHLEGVTILARITSAISRQYTAEILGFEQWNEEHFKGMKPGDTVHFSYAQAFGFCRL